MMDSNKLTYISLFSSAGIGCYGFKLQGFNCIATNELIPRRLDIQRYNNKCKYARWIDQKCAADVVTVVADCIYNYISEKSEVIFTTQDIWHYSYAVENIEAVFKKPGVESTATRNEYDKFFQQPMEMLANAKVLQQIEYRKTCLIQCVKKFMNFQIF